MQKYHRQDQEHYQDGVNQPEHKHIITYDLTELMRIRHVTANDIRYKQLSFGTVRLLHNLKLNRGTECLGRSNKENHKTYRRYLGKLKVTTMSTQQGDQTYGKAPINVAEHSIDKK